MVYLDSPAPTRVTVSLTCKNGNTGTNYSEPYTVTQDLTPHKSPTSEGSYLFPYSISDLRSMEYFTEQVTGAEKAPKFLLMTLGSWVSIRNYKNGQTH